MGRILALTSLLLLVLGAAPHVAAANVPNSDLDPTSIQGDSVDCGMTPHKLICEFLQQARLVPYAGPKTAIAHRVDSSDGGGALAGVQAWVLDWPAAQPLVPFSACTESDKCERAAAAVCKAAGKGGTQAGSVKIVKDTNSGDNSCQAKCASGDTVYVVCLGS